MTNRIITPTDIQNAERLNSIYQRKRKELGLTQEQIAEEMGVTQPAISQQLTGKVALTTDNILAWAVLLEVPAYEIDPSLKKVKLLFNAENIAQKTIAVFATVKNKTPSQKTINVTITTKSSSASLVAYEVDTTDFSPLAEPGDFIIIDLAQAPRRGSKVLVRLKDKLLPGVLIDSNPLLVNDILNKNKLMFENNKLLGVHKILSVIS